MIAIHAAATGGDGFGGTYEDLRRYVLKGAAVGGAGGLVLLLRDGLAAWMARGAVGSGPVERAGPPARCAAVPRVLDAMDAAVVRVLVSMALSGHPETRA